MKEDIKPKDGKRKLYFSIDLKNYISFLPDQNPTCDSILQNHKPQILSTITDVYHSPNIDLNNYAFFLVDLKNINIKKGQQNNLAKIKLNPNCKYSFFLQNPKTILCFLPKNPIVSDGDNKNNGNKIIIEENEKLLETKKNYIKNEQIDNFFSNKTIYLYDYDNRLYNKLKGNLSLKQLTIHGKVETIIYIQEIRTIMYCDSSNPMVEGLRVTSGYKPSHFIIIKTNDNQFTIGLKSEEKLNKWREGLNNVLAYYKTFTTDIDFKININDLKKIILENEKGVIDDTLIYENLLKNPQKKKIFYSLFEDEKLPKLIEGIFSYQNLINNSKYQEGIFKLYEILEMVELNNKEENQSKKSDISKIINKDSLDKYADIYNKANNLINKENNDVLKDILKSNLFDDSLFYLNELYIVPTLNKFKEEFKELSQTNGKSKERKNIERLIAYYFMKSYKMTDEKSVLEL